MQAKEVVLVVDDELGMRAGLSEVLRRAGYDVLQAASGEEALPLVKAGNLSLVISDMRMPGLSGLGLLQHIRTRQPHLPVVMITAYGTVEDAVEAMKAGARDFLTKPFSPSDILHLVARLKEERRGSAAGVGALVRSERQPLKRAIVTRDSGLARIIEIVEAVAGSRAPVLIQGESGTGKELLARHLHAAGPGEHRPFVAVNCAALPRELLESELFGHEKGAFTGAVGRKLGKFEQANGGTLLLDEISELELGLQAKLLRVLQEWEIDRIGGTHPVSVDVRVVATTNRNLRKTVASGAFRRDLYYRLNVVPITVPPLRERKGDIDILIDYFLAKFSQGGKNIDDKARELLRQQPWPGNVRELENLLERATLLSPRALLTIDDFVLEDRGEEEATEERSLAGLTVREVEKRLIIDTLHYTRNNRSHAARMLGISIRTLRNKLAEYRTRGEFQLQESQVPRRAAS